MHDKRKAIKPGTVVKLDITLWPMGMVFAAGEGIMLRVAGHDMCYPETEMIRVTEAVDENVGDHVIHTGGEHDSYLIIPVIPKIEGRLDSGEGTINHQKL
jgi:predicted acyl esterase